MHGRREIASLALRLESLASVRAVAERLVFGKTAAAERDHRASRESEGRAFRIHNFKITLNANGAILQNRYFGCHLDEMVTDRSQL